jgi:Tfp pilus assembly protein PilO
MPKNFKLPSIPKLPALGALKDTQVLIRLLLGILVAANLVAAGFAFHLFDDSPEQIARQVQSTNQQVLSQIVKLNQTRMHAGKVEKGREEGTKFISTYMTGRRKTYSTIISEIDGMSNFAGMRSKEWNIGLDAVKGSETLDMMTITANFEGDYKNLLIFINQIDLSKRFLIIESLAASPQQNGSLQVTLNLNTFVTEDTNNETRGRT